MKFAGLVAGCALAVLSSWAGEDGCVSTVSGAAGQLPPSYAAPLSSNGSLCLLIDPQGCQFQRSYAKMIPCIWRAGRRYGPKHEDMVPFGHFEQEIAVDGKLLAAPERWTQSLDSRDGLVTCRGEHADGLTVETVVFTHLAQDLVVVKKRIAPGRAPARSGRLTFRYQLTPPGEENRVPRRMLCTLAWDPGEQSADFRYKLDGHVASEGVVSVFCGSPAAAVLDGQAVALTAEVALPGEVTFFLLFADTLEGKGHLERAAQTRAWARKEGFAGTLAAHRQAWEPYWAESEVRLPSGRLQRVYRTAQYHLRCNATRWSFPVGIFPTHWAGKYFGWDEMFCHHALISSNHDDLARRCPEFRFAGLSQALNRASHYGKPGSFGARFPWETLEDGTEGAPPGFWMDHVFHMSNISGSAWVQFLYTGDLGYLESTGYPVIRECARFFLANMIYEALDGGMFLGKCTDLERLGPARLNPYMTSCGAIDTLEAAAEAAERLRVDETESPGWRQAAGKLRDSLPREENRFIPYPGCKERSIASLGGLFPYPVWDETNAAQRNAAYHFLEHGRASGNMYPVGNSVCAWYAGWMASALARLGDREEPGKLLEEAARGAGGFGELFEINEAQVSMRPWFATASGNFVYALNQMLVQSRGEEIRLAPGVPRDWKDYGFRLPCHGDLMLEAAVEKGVLKKLTLAPGARQGELERKLRLPPEWLAGVSLNRAVVVAEEKQAGQPLLRCRFQGRVELIQRREP